MANSIDLAKKFVPIIDGVYKAESVTNGIDAATKADFTGVNEVKVLKVSTTGLGDYSRENGYPKGDVTAAWETLTLTEERGKEISVDRMDNEETLGLTFGTVTGEFMRLHVIPELDAYRFAKYASTPGINSVATPAILTKDSIIAAIDEAVRQMDADEVPMAGRKLYINSDLKPILNGALARQWGSDGIISTALAGYNDMPITWVPKSRFYTDITLNDGSSNWGYTKTAAVYAASTDTTVDGSKTYYTKSGNVYTPVSNPTGNPSTSSYYERTSEGAADINFMIIYPPAILQVVKFSLPKIFDPDVNQKKDAWMFQFREYHDAFVYENKAKGLYLHKKPVV